MTSDDLTIELTKYFLVTDELSKAVGRVSPAGSADELEAPTQQTVQIHQPQRGVGSI